MWPKEGKRWRVMIHFSWLEVESLRRKVTVLCARLPCFMQAKIVIFSESEQRKSFHWQDVKLSRFGIVLNCQGYNWNHNSYLLILSVLLSAKVKIYKDNSDSSECFYPVHSSGRWHCFIIPATQICVCSFHSQRTHLQTVEEAWAGMPFMCDKHDKNWSINTGGVKMYHTVSYILAPRVMATSKMECGEEHVSLMFLAAVNNRCSWWGCVWW